MGGELNQTPANPPGCSALREGPSAYKYNFSEWGLWVRLVLRVPLALVMFKHIFWGSPKKYTPTEVDNSLHDHGFIDICCESVLQSHSMY